MIPRWYWIAAVLALLWNLLGCLFFAMELFAQEAMMESMTESQREWARSIPAWIYFVYAVAVATGVAGCLGLLMRRRWSLSLCGVCLAAVMIQMVYTMLIAGGLNAMGPSGLIMPVVVIVIAAATVWLAWTARSRGWFHRTRDTAGA